ncbi:MAG: amidohydrolase family protein [Proteobacteria bacterium]|nr:amidohydrolase family protein [Pseudomonadota bacterium]
MIIDCHTHIFPEEIGLNRERFLDGEPAFKMIYASSKSEMIGAEALIKQMDESGVDISVVCGFPWVNPDTVKMNNDYCMEAVSKYPKRLIGLACFDAYSRKIADETERCIKGNLKGVGELAFYLSGIDDDALDRLTPVMEICKANDCPVMFHTNESVGHIYPGKTEITLPQIYNIAKRFPENNIILAHWGGGIFFYNLMKREVRETLKNIYYDTAASLFLYTSEIYKYAVDLAGKDKILFGSDYPLIKPTRYFKEIEISGLSPEDARLIKGENAAALFNLVAP